MVEDLVDRHWDIFEQLVFDSYERQDGIELDEFNIAVRRMRDEFFSYLRDAISAYQNDFPA